MGQLDEFLKQGLAGQELSQETLFASTVTIGGEELVCSTSGFRNRQRLADDGAGLVPVFLITLRVRREVLEEEAISSSSYALGSTVTHEGRSATVVELIDRAELPHIVLRCTAPGDV